MRTRPSNGHRSFKSCIVIKLLCVVRRDAACLLRRSITLSMRLKQNGVTLHVVQLLCGETLYEKQKAIVEGWRNLYCQRNTSIYCMVVYVLSEN